MNQCEDQRVLIEQAIDHPKEGDADVIVIAFHRQLSLGTTPEIRNTLSKITRSQNNQTTPNSQMITGTAVLGVTKVTAATTGFVNWQKKRQM